MTDLGYDWLIVGAGFAGCVMAERIAAQRQESVLLIDRRDHIGGNAHDHLNAEGLLVHRYGPHIFHTNSKPVFDYLSAFTAWHPYEHRALASVDGRLLPFPINLDTINRLYGLSLDEAGLAAWYRDQAVPVEEVRTSEDVVISQVGRDLFEKFFRNYTRKQWGVEPRDLDKSVTARIPVRTNRDDRYFTDEFQFMPRHGYTELFRAMTANRLITVALSTGFGELRHRAPRKGTIYTGPIDEYFACRLGRLPYRSLRFVHATLDVPRFQPCGTVNYPNEHDYTRITEYKHMTGQSHARTAVTYEYPSTEGDPYYPIPNGVNHALLARYEALAAEQQATWFVGRLANYRYYNMDQVVGQALSQFRRLDASVPRG